MVFKIIHLRCNPLLPNKDQDPHAEDWLYIIKNHMILLNTFKQVADFTSKYTFFSKLSWKESFLILQYLPVCHHDRPCISCTVWEWWHIIKLSTNGISVESDNHRDGINIPFQLAQQNNYTRRCQSSLSAYCTDTMKDVKKGIQQESQDWR